MGWPPSSPLDQRPIDPNALRETPQPVVRPPQAPSALGGAHAPFAEPAPTVDEIEPSSEPSAVESRGHLVEVAGELAGFRDRRVPGAGTHTHGDLESVADRFEV